jgi:FkbM family methyltransferase
MKSLFRLALKSNRGEEKDNNSFRSRICKYVEPKIEKISIIDVGANRGNFYDELKSIYPKAKIRALLIEPIPECINVLKQKWEGNELVSLCNIAISNTIESKEFFIYKFDETSSLLKIKNNIKELNDINTATVDSLKLTTNTLDNIVEKYALSAEKIDILKIDVQGYEDKVLLGAPKTLKKTRYLWIEVSFKALYDGTCLFNDIHNILIGLNFILLEISDGHRSPENELLQANCLYKNTNFNSELINVEDC